MNSDAPPRLDIIIPVYNEGANILPTLQSILRTVKTPPRVLICYDREDDDTLPAINDNRAALGPLAISFVRNRGRGAHGAVLAGFAASKAPFAIVLPADDDYNAGILDAMVARAEAGCDIVCASRFMPGGSMTGCPWLKAALVRAGNFSLFHLARLPTRDASNGFRLFSRRVMDDIVSRIGSGLLLQHRAAGEMPSARLAYWRGPGAVVRTRPRHQPLPGHQMAAGLSALVPLCVRHHLPQTAGPAPCV